MDLQKKVITVSSVETEQTKSGKTRTKIKDENNLLFSIWHTKQDGTQSKAWTQFEPMGMNAVGKSFNIAYSVNPGDYQGKPIEYRSIVMIEETDQANPVTYDTSNSQTTQSGGGDVMKALREIYSLLSIINGKLGIDTPKTPEKPTESNLEPNTAPPQTNAAQQMKQGIQEAGKVKTDDSVFDEIVNSM